jgi:hypothetical protein
MLAFIIIFSIKLATECVVERADQNVTESGKIPAPVGNGTLVLYADMLLVCACVCMYYVCTMCMYASGVCRPMCVCVSACIMYALYVCMQVVCVSACMHVCMYVCMKVCTCVLTKLDDFMNITSNVTYCIVGHRKLSGPLGTQILSARYITNLNSLCQCNIKECIY